MGEHATLVELRRRSQDEESTQRFQRRQEYIELINPWAKISERVQRIKPTFPESLANNSRLR